MMPDLRNHHLTCIGYHGCEKSLAREIIMGQKPMQPSKNKYDWLGEGVYFWENDPVRALEFARDTNDPFVVGAVLDLGYCLDLTCREGLNSLKMAWTKLVLPSITEGTTITDATAINESDLPIKNKAAKKGENGELMLRFLDCHVITALHQFNAAHGIPDYDSIRGAFWEGDAVYPTAGFMDKNHIQLCVCNPDCILGVFLPKGLSL